jgi:hypothetical protein
VTNDPPFDQSCAEIVYRHGGQEHVEQGGRGRLRKFAPAYTPLSRRPSNAAINVLVSCFAQSTITSGRKEC